MVTSYKNVTIVSEGVCNTVGYFEEGASFSALAPKEAICPGHESNTSDNAAEFATVLQITMFLGLLFLLFVMYRSCNRTRVDWYRLIFAYILGTLGVPISIALGPGYGGFNRIAGFGIMVHNMAELFILGRIWRGLRPSKNSSFGVKFVVMYVWIILALITFVPLSPLFVILMIQGSCCDFTLVATFYCIGQALEYKSSDASKGKCGKHCNFGLAAAITHILSIQPLFFGFSTGIKLLDGITVMLLIPTFIIYIWFAAADSDSVALILSPNPTGLNMLAKAELDELKIIAHHTKAPGDREMNNLGVDSGLGATGLAQRGGNNNDNENVLDSAVSEATRDLEDREQKSLLDKVLGDGLMRTSSNKKAFRNSLIFGVVMCILDSMLGWFLPCMIDTSFLCK